MLSGVEISGRKAAGQVLAEGEAHEGDHEEDEPEAHPARRDEPEQRRPGDAGDVGEEEEELLAPGVVGHGADDGREQQDEQVAEARCRAPEEVPLARGRHQPGEVDAEGDGDDDRGVAAVGEVEHRPAHDLAHRGGGTTRASLGAMVAFRCSGTSGVKEETLTDSGLELTGVGCIFLPTFNKAGRSYATLAERLARRRTVPVEKLRRAGSHEKQAGYGRQHRYHRGLRAGSCGRPDRNLVRESLFGTARPQGGPPQVEEGEQLRPVQAVVPAGSDRALVVALVPDLSFLQ